MVLRERRKILSIQEGIFNSGFREVKKDSGTPFEGTSSVVGMQTGVDTMENGMESPRKNVKLKLLYDPVIPLLNIHPKKPKALIQKSICTPMFTAVLFTIAKIWKQFK